MLHGVHFVIFTADSGFWKSYPAPAAHIDCRNGGATSFWCWVGDSVSGGGGGGGGALDCVPPKFCSLCVYMETQLLSSGRGKSRQLT